MPLDLSRLSGVAEEEATRRLASARRRLEVDIASWAESNFYIEETAAPIKLLPHQVAYLRYAFKRLREDDPRLLLFPHLAARIGHFPFQTVVISTVKKAGKTTLAALIARFVAETQTRFGEIYCMGNDFAQAQERAFKELSKSIKLTPGCKQKSGVYYVPNRYMVQQTKIECLTSGSTIRPVSVDAPGEAGANPDLTLWTELWGFEHQEARRFYQEMTPVPTKVDSIRLIDTYAGYDGESELLKEVYDLGIGGRQLTAGELSSATDTPPDVFAETEGDLDAHVPVYVNEQASLLMLWDEGEIARRMPWQKGEQARSYYQAEALKLPPAAYTRLHLNRWTGGESEFIPIEIFDACQEALPRLATWDAGPVVLGVDAAVTGDCFGIVAVTRHPERHDDVAIRRVKKWDPAESGGVVDYAEPEKFLRALCLGSCAAGHPKQKGWPDESPPS